MPRRVLLNVALLILIIGPLDSVHAQAPPVYKVDDLGSLGGHYLIGLAINNSGDVAGYGDLPDGTYHAFRWTRSGGLEDLGANGGGMSRALRINDNGDVVGVYNDSSNHPHGFIARRGGAIEDLRTPERPIIRVDSITNDGWMAEDATTTKWSRAFQAKRGLPMEDLGTLGSDVADGEGIKDSSAIGGWTFAPFGFTGFLNTAEGGMIDLSTRILSPPGETPMLWGAHGINNAGQIIVEVALDARHGTYLLTPFQDTEPPIIAALAAAPHVLWPPDHRMVSVSVQASATDNLDPGPDCSIAGVTNSEGPAAGSDPDIVVSGALTVSLRSTRFEEGPGRRYTVSVSCTDLAGNASTANTVVNVPHDVRQSSPEGRLCSKPEQHCGKQKILDHREIVVSDPIGALAHLQLGRAFVLSGNTTRAKTAYRDFLTLWKDAGPDIPLFKQAQAEYARLK